MQRHIWLSRLESFLIHCRQLLSRLSNDDDDDTAQSDNHATNMAASTLHNYANINSAFQHGLGACDDSLWLPRKFFERDG